MPPTAPHRSELIYRILLLAALLAMVVVSIQSLRPPARDSDRFSTDAALSHLDFIASETHPVGLPHHKAVHEYLMNEFARLGYRVESQEAASVIPLSNVIARRAGQVPGNKAVMLSAHYDSVRWGPGAADDSAAVAALLEVARDMSTSFYRNDIIFLITDGEELGLWGAKLFVDQNPWANDVGVVLNFDARGSSGPSIMYETSDHDGWLIDQYTQVDPHPVCGSMTQEVYKKMPNRTDFTVFRQTMPGLNFAFIGSYANYHNENDNLAHLDIASMRHQGLQALAMAERLAQQDLSQARSGGNDVYFDVLSWFVLRYPMSRAPWIAIGVSILTLAFLGVALGKGAVSITGFCVSCAVLILNLIMVSGLSWAMIWAMRKVALNQYANWTIAGFALLACAITVAVFYSGLKLSSLDLAAAGLTVWTLLTLLTGLVTRGYSYLTVWPLLFSTIGFGFAICFGGRNGLVRTVILALCALPTTLLLPRVIYLAFLGLRVTGLIPFPLLKINLAATPILVIPIVLALWLLPLQIGPARPLPLPADAA